MPYTRIFFIRYWATQRVFAANCSSPQLACKVTRSPFCKHLEAFCSRPNNSLLILFKSTICITTLKQATNCPTAHRIIKTWCSFQLAYKFNKRGRIAHADHTRDSIMTVYTHNAELHMYVSKHNFKLIISNNVSLWRYPFPTTAVPLIKKGALQHDWNISDDGSSIKTCTYLVDHSRISLYLDAERSSWIQFPGKGRYFWTHTTSGNVQALWDKPDRAMQSSIITPSLQCCITKSQHTDLSAASSDRIMLASNLCTSTYITRKQLL